MYKNVVSPTAGGHTHYVYFRYTKYWIRVFSVW